MALVLLDEGGGQGLSMRSLAMRLGVTPMSLYHHVADHTGLLRALSDRVYGEVLEGAVESADPADEIRTILTRYHDTVGRHPQLTLAIFAEPAAFAGVTRQITDRITFLLKGLTSDPFLWRDILIDHAHGSGLALVSARSEPGQVNSLREQYARSLDLLVQKLSVA